MRQLWSIMAKRKTTGEIRVVKIAAYEEEEAIDVFKNLYPYLEFMEVIK